MTREIGARRGHPGRRRPARPARSAAGWSWTRPGRADGAVRSAEVPSWCSPSRSPPAPALAYEERVHQLIGERALPATMPRDLARATPVDVDELRSATWRAGAGHPDASVRERFIARYPSERQFDGWAWKEFLGLTPEARVVGVDVVPEGPADARHLLALSSRFPDDDRRNFERFAHDPDRRVRRDASGKPIPLDPAQLDMGALTGLSSQAWAHYGLPRVEFSDSPDVLKTDPRRWAYPPTAKAFGPEMAQLHTDVALAAADRGHAGRPRARRRLAGRGPPLRRGRGQPDPHPPGRLPVLRRRQDGELEGERLFPLGLASPPPRASRRSGSASSRTTTSSWRTSGVRGYSTPPRAGEPARERWPGLDALVTGDAGEEAALDALRLDPARPVRPGHHRAAGGGVEPRGSGRVPGGPGHRPAAPLQGPATSTRRARPTPSCARPPTRPGWPASTSWRPGASRARRARSDATWRLFEAEVARAEASEAARARGAGRRARRLVAVVARCAWTRARPGSPPGSPRGPSRRGELPSRSREATSSGQAIEKRSPRSRFR